MSTPGHSLLLASDAATDGLPVFLWVALAVAVLGLGVVVLVAAVRKRPRTGAELLCQGCKRVMLPEWTRCLFCGRGVGELVAELAFVSGPMQGQLLPLDKDVTTIGSVAGNTVLLTDTGVSRKHAGIRRVEGGYELADLGSTNGVYVNGERVARRRLAAGDVIRVGTSEMVFKG